MSRKVRKTQISATPPAQARGRGGRLAFLGYTLALLAGGIVLGGAWSARPGAERASTEHGGIVPASYYELLAMTPEQLARVDLALMNLLCAKGLPGAENLDIPAALAQLDAWAAKVRFETERHLYRVADPRYAAHYGRSEARFRAEFLVQVLQEDCGVHYNEQRIRDVDFSNPADLFIHGLIHGDHGGTCSSMPVLYAAVGRRLGYPIRLVLAKQHVFCRWDDGQARFNIEGATNGGVDFYPDEYYRAWPMPISDAEMASGEFLKSLSPREELAAFLLQRASCWQVHGGMNEARACLAEALCLMPHSPTLRTALRSTFGPGGVAARRIPRDYKPPVPPEVRPSLPPDPTPRIPMPGVNPTFGIPHEPIGAVQTEVRR